MDDPRVVKIVQYENEYEQTVWGVMWEGESGDLTRYDHMPSAKTIWEVK
jgi:hypothetical protein